MRMKNPKISHSYPNVGITAFDLLAYFEDDLQHMHSVLLRKLGVAEILIIQHSIDRVLSTDKRQGIAGIIFLLMLMVFSTPTVFHSASAQISTGTNNIGVYAGDSIPYGLNYSAWQANWWKWLMQIESNANPASDSTGANCIKNQSGSVWFLAGSTSGSASRTCTIPAGKAILFPVVGAECSYAENPNLKSESELRNCAVTIVNVVSHIEAKVDTMSLQNSQMPRIQSPLFSFTFPGNNIFGAPGGPSKSVGDGFFVFLKPLTVGKHDIAFKATGVQYTNTGVNNLSQDIEYHLTVQ